MPHIASDVEFASVLRKGLEVAQQHTLLLELAEGLVADELGDQDPWPAVAKSVVLSAAARAFFNPQGLLREGIDGVSGTRASPELGVYLTDDELKRLRRWKTDHLGNGKPTFSFPGTWPFPDRVEREPDTITG